MRKQKKSKFLDLAESIEYLELGCTEHSFRIRYLYGKDPLISSIKTGRTRKCSIEALDAFIEKNTKRAK